MLGALGHGFQNEGDNEITCSHMSDGEPGTDGFWELGHRTLPERWRLFRTAQHGDNVTWEVIPGRW